MPFPSRSLPSRVPALEEEVAEGEQRGYKQRLSQGAHRASDGEGPIPACPTDVIWPGGLGVDILPGGHLRS